MAPSPRRTRCKTDALLIAGSSFPYIEFYPKPGAARAVQIELAPERIGLRYPVEVGLVGACKSTLAALLPRLTYREDRGFLEDAQRGMADWRELMEKRGSRTDKPMKPDVVARELDRLLRDDAARARVEGPSPVQRRATKRRRV